MLDRRQFNKCLATVPFLSGLLINNESQASTIQKSYCDIDELNKQFFEQDKFANIFTLVDCKQDYIHKTSDGLEYVEFPLDFLPIGFKGQLVGSHINRNKQIIWDVERDYVGVPFVNYEFERASTISEIIDKVTFDAWNCAMAAATDRNIVVYDSDEGDIYSENKKFSCRLVSLLKVIMRRNAGNNSASINRGKCTHIFVHAELLNHTKDWKLDSFSEKETVRNSDNSIKNIFGVELIANKFLPRRYAKYQNSIDLYNVLAVDLYRNDNMVMPVNGKFELVGDKIKGKIGIAVLSNRKLLWGKV